MCGEDVGPPHQPAWLEQAVFYEIYPQTFADSNGDGIGDLRGIIGKLPYLHDLGITAIWLNPCFESPFRDAGYDISDFYRVAPRYGTNEDLRELFTVARRLGIRVMLDLVAGHTSDQHPWFRQSQRADHNPYSDWFIWTNSVWRAPKSRVPYVTGESERDGNYLVNFFSFQPALNYGYAKPDPAEPWQQAVDAPGPRAVREEMRKIMAFWFDQGASGFRVDMAASLVKNDSDGAATSAIWRGFRAWINEKYPDCALVSEWSNPPVAIPAGFHMDFLLPWNKPGYKALFRGSDGLAAIFSRKAGPGIRKFLDEFEPLYAATQAQGFIAIPTGNHDTVPRIGNGRDDRDLAAVYAFLLTMPGVPFLYYGDEIGMRSLDGLPSKEGGYGRTGARTPMQWDNSANAGFSSAPADRLYLPVDSRSNRPTVTAQLADPASLWHAVKALIALRQSHPALCASGGFRTLASGDGTKAFVYERTKGAERILIAINPSGDADEVRLPSLIKLAATRPLHGETGAFQHDETGWFVRLPGVSCAIVEAVAAP